MSRHHVADVRELNQLGQLAGTTVDPVEVQGVRPMLLGEVERNLDQRGGFAGSEHAADGEMAGRREIDQMGNLALLRRAVGEPDQDRKMAGGAFRGLSLLGRDVVAERWQPQSLPPAILLISDGMPTDEYKSAMGRFLDEPMGRRSVRMAVGIGRDADVEVLDRFVGDSEHGPLTANNPEQLVQMIRWASTHASRVASNLAPQVGVAMPDLQEARDPGLDERSELIW